MKKLIVLESFAYETLNFVRACSRSAETKQVSLCSRSIAALSNLACNEVEMLEYGRCRR